MAVVGRVILRERFVVIPESLQRQTLEQLNVNHMCEKGKPKLLYVT